MVAATAPRLGSDTASTSRRSIRRNFTRRVDRVSSEFATLKLATVAMSSAVIVGTVIDFDRGVDDLFVHRDPAANDFRGQRLVMRDDAGGAGVGRLADPPDMEVRHARFAGAATVFDGLP